MGAVTLSTPGSTAASTTDRVVVAVDGGNSKTDVVALRLDGTIAGRAAAGPSSPHQAGVDGSIARLTQLVDEVRGGARVVQANVYLAGLDLEGEVANYRAAIRACDWTSASTVVDNDIFALLRAGGEEESSVAVVCGAGLNAVGLRADGATARFAALGSISGDWGGGNAIGELALWFATRGSDSRGRHTMLESAIPAEYGMDSLAHVTEALHLGDLPMTELGRLAPVVFSLAGHGDEVAGQIVDRQAREIARMAASCIYRLELGDTDVPVILGGGVLRSADSRLLDGIRSLVTELAPRTELRLVTAPPIVGAALLALEHAGATRAALATAEVALAI